MLHGRFRGFRAAGSIAPPSVTIRAAARLRLARARTTESALTRLRFPPYPRGALAFRWARCQNARSYEGVVTSLVTQAATSRASENAAGSIFRFFFILPTSVSEIGCKPR
jgi:hypothetical protein